MNIVVRPDPDALALEAAERTIAAAAEAIRERGRFLWALSGGSTPKKAYEVLARPENRARLDWSRAWLFLGDERMVPPDDERSNYGLAVRTLLTHVPRVPEQVFAVPTHLGPREAAVDYARTLIDVAGPEPRFDLIWLGLGDDGHTASLFPGMPSLGETALVTWSPPGVLPPPVDRVTFTLPTINAARRVMFLVAGAGKAAVVARVRAGGDVREVPAAGVRAEEVVWLCDEAASATAS